MKWILLFTVILLCGCEKREYGPELTENAIVEQTIFTPSQHGSAIGPTISGSGNIGLAMTAVNVPKSYAVVFKCQHGKFVLQGRKYESLWKKLSTGQNVIIKYREVFAVSNKGRRLIDYDFIDAEPAP